MSIPVIEVDGLTAEAAGRRLLSSVSCTVVAGQILAVVGASGSGKTTLGRALLGEAGPGVSLTGRVRIEGGLVSPGSPAPGGLVGYIPQQPAAALNPVRRIGAVLREIARHHDRGGWWTRRDEARRNVRTTLSRVGLAADRELLRRFPHQLSGGQQQRLVIAHALLSAARVIIADEPTTGQDSLNRDDIAVEMRRLTDTGVAVVLLSHDLHLVRAVADHTIVLDHGTVVASGPTADVLDGSGQHHAVAASSSVRAAEAPAEAVGVPFLRGTAITARHHGGTVLHGVDLTIAAGQCLAVVGRSGSGKTTLARCLAGLHRPATGVVELDGRPLAATLDRRSRADLAAVQYVFQDPRASFHPYRPVLDQVARAAVRLHGSTVANARRAAQAVLDQVELPTDLTTRRPDRLSGGELQRAALARSLLARPRLLICDEITAGLDAAVQDHILTLVEQLRRTHDLTLLVISHDPAVVARLAEHILVLEHGRIVEHGPAPALLTAGREPLTRALLDPNVHTVTREQERSVSTPARLEPSADPRAQA